MAARDQSVIVAIAAIYNFPFGHRLGDAHECIDVAAGKLMRAGGPQHCVGKVLARRGARGLPVEGCPLADLPDPPFPRDRLIDHAQHRPAILHQGNQRAEDRAPGDEAGRSIDRIENPLPCGTFVACAIFLADDPIVCSFAFENRAHRRLGCTVGFGHEALVWFTLLRPFAAKEGPDGFPCGIGETIGEREIGISLHLNPFGSMLGPVKTTHSDNVMPFGSHRRGK